MKTQIWMVSEHKVDQICITFIYMHLPNLKWLDPIEIPLGQPFAQPKVRRDPISARQKWSDIGSNWRKLASSLRRFWSWK